MGMRRIGRLVVRVLWVLLIGLAGAAQAAAQGNPTGAIRGEVVDPSNLALPGVTVTGSSPALQGTRTTVTSSNGDFIIPFLPAGEYTVVFELTSFRNETRRIGVAMAETQPIKVTLALASLTEVVTVTGTAFTEVLKTNTIA